MDDHSGYPPTTHERLRWQWAHERATALCSCQTSKIVQVCEKRFRSNSVGFPHTYRLMVLAMRMFRPKKLLETEVPTHTRPKCCATAEDPRAVARLNLLDGVPIRLSVPTAELLPRRLNGRLRDILECAPSLRPRQHPHFLAGTSG